MSDAFRRGPGAAAGSRHGDKNHLHLHVAINLIHPETFRAASVHRDYRKLAELAAGLEIKHGLERTEHGVTAARGQDAVQRDLC